MLTIILKPHKNLNQKDGSIIFGRKIFRTLIPDLKPINNWFRLMAL